MTPQPLDFSLTFSLGHSLYCRYVSMLYSMGTVGGVDPRDTQREIREKISWSPWWFLRPSRMFTYRHAMKDKKRCGQPVSFTDFFGHFVGEHLTGKVKGALDIFGQTILASGIARISLTWRSLPGHHKKRIVYNQTKLKQFHQYYQLQVAKKKGSIFMLSWCGL